MVQNIGERRIPLVQVLSVKPDTPFSHRLDGGETIYAVDVYKRKEHTIDIHKFKNPPIRKYEVRNEGDFYSAINSSKPGETIRLKIKTRLQDLIFIGAKKYYLIVPSGTSAYIENEHDLVGRLNVKSKETNKYVNRKGELYFVNPHYTTVGSFIIENVPDGPIEVEDLESISFILFVDINLDRDFLNEFLKTFDYSLDLYEIEIYENDFQKYSFILPEQTDFRRFRINNSEGFYNALNSIKEGESVRFMTTSDVNPYVFWNIANITDWGITVRDIELK